MSRVAPSGVQGLRDRAVARSGGRVPAPERQTGFRAAAVGFVLMTALVVIATTGVFVLLDPRAQAFWGAKLGDLVAFARSVAGR
ncbi:MAG TPA: hypothetical protein VM070_01880 [Candidatus Saccharimonadales bacterium]|nr:hypothetical protein [Candidatus Saccharimonadales bacterium]